MNTGLIFKVIDDTEERVKKQIQMYSMFDCSALNPMIDRMQIPNIIEKAEQDGIAFEDAYIAILAHMAKHKMNEIDFDISKIENSIIRCDCCHKLIEKPIKLNLPYELEVCQSCASKIEDYVNSLSRKDEDTDFLSEKDIADFFLDPIASICKENGIKVSKKILPHAPVKCYKFYYGNKCVSSYDTHITSTDTSLFTSTRLASRIFQAISELEPIKKNYHKLNFKAVSDIFLDQVADFCARKNIGVFEKHKSGNMRLFEFRLDEECIYSFKICKSSSKISPEASGKLYAALVRNVKAKEEK